MNGEAPPQLVRKPVPAPSLKPKPKPAVKPPVQTPAAIATTGEIQGNQEEVVKSSKSRGSYAEREGKFNRKLRTFLLVTY